MGSLSSANPDLTTSEGILAALCNTHLACSSVEQLSGGFSYYTWRGILRRPLPNGASSVVIKHAEAFAALEPELAFDPIRIDFEAQVMRQAYTSLRLPLHNRSGSIRVPEVYHHDNINKILVIEDAGADATDLKSYILTGRVRSQEDVEIIAQALADFASAMHRWGKSESQQRCHLREDLKTHTWATTMSVFLVYGRLVETIDIFPSGCLEPYRDTFAKVHMKMTKETWKSSDQGIIHGDYWAGNIIVANPQNADSDSDSSQPPPLGLRVIDWETTRLAPAFFDIAQMAAELFLAFHFKGIQESLQLLDTFLARYSGLESPDARSRYSLAVHFGAYLVVWPVRIPGWDDIERIEECARIGASFVQKGFEQDAEWLRDSVLNALFK